MKKVMQTRKRKLEELHLNPIEFTIQFEDGTSVRAVRASMKSLLTLDIKQAVHNHTLIINADKQTRTKIDVRINGDGRDLGKRGKNNSVVVTFTLLQAGSVHNDTNIQYYFWLKATNAMNIFVQV